MTVSELQNKLKEYSPDMKVCHLDRGVCGGDYEVNKVSKVVSDDHNDQEIVLLLSD